MTSVSSDDATGDWIFQFEDVTLLTASPWRLVADGRIVLGWRDDGQVFGLKSPIDAPECIRAQVATSTVATAWTDGPGDLHIRFGETLTLQVFNDSIGYEGWQLFGPGDRHVIGLGGGGVHESESID